MVLCIPLYPFVFVCGCASMHMGVSSRLLFYKAIDIKSRGEGEFHYPVWPTVWSVARTILAGLAHTPVFVYTHIVLAECFVGRSCGRRYVCVCVGWVAWFILLCFNWLVYLLFYSLMFSQIIEISCFVCFSPFFFFPLINIWQMCFWWFWKAFEETGWAFLTILYFYFFFF